MRCTLLAQPCCFEREPSRPSATLQTRRSIQKRYCRQSYTCNNLAHIFPCWYSASREHSYTCSTFVTWPLSS